MSRGTGLRLEGEIYRSRGQLRGHTEDEEIGAGGDDEQQGEHLGDGEEVLHEGSRSN